MKEKILKEELKGFNVSIDDIEPSDDMFGAIEQAITKMNTEYLVDRCEVVLNNNLIDCKDKITNFRTILGCRVSYDNLSKDISFIVREDTKPTYEQLGQELERYKNIIGELKWKPIEEYEKPKYDWVLVKYFIEPNFECIPCVAENRFGKWYDRNDNLINGEVRYFADMQLLDTLGELKGE